MKQLPIYLIVVLIFVIACKPEEKKMEHQGKLSTKIIYNERDTVFDQPFEYDWSFRIHSIENKFGSGETLIFAPIEFDYNGQKQLIPIIWYDLISTGGLLNNYIDSINYKIYEQDGFLKTRVNFTLQISTEGGLLEKYNTYSSRCISNLIKDELERKPTKDNPIKIFQYSDDMAKLIHKDGVFHIQRSIEMTNFNDYAIIKMTQTPENANTIPKQFLKDLLEIDDIVVEEELIRTDTIPLENFSYYINQKLLKKSNCKSFQSKLLIDYVGM